MQELSGIKADIFRIVSEKGPVDPGVLSQELGIEQSRIAQYADALCQEGQLMKTKKGKLAFPSQLGFLLGRIQGNPRRFAFFLPSGEGPDLFVSRDALHGAMHGDTVLVRCVKGTEAEVHAIVKRANDVLVGTLELDGGENYVVPDERRIFVDIHIPGGQLQGAKDNDKVVVRIVKYQRDGRNPIGRVIEVLGQKGDPEADFLSILRVHHLDEHFPQNVLSEAGREPDHVCDADIIGREDLRAVNTFTIDGADARDFDDAVSIERLNGGYRLGVHIADVSHYVRKGSALDVEASRRTTSVYFPGHVLPMLPEQLSNGICSLNPDVDRLTFSCIMDIDLDGNVGEYRIVPSVIRSKARLVYEDVTAALETGKPLNMQGQYDDLCLMQELFHVLNERRMKRGALDLDVDESHIILDGAGNPLAVEKAQRGVANRIIEEFMLVANETVAAHAKHLDLPFMYRVHEQPDPEKIKAFELFISNLGIALKGAKGEVHPKALQQVLAQVEGREESAVVSSVLLRSLQKARYFPSPLGHFGLAAKDYCHFTSPIRRYPDLFIHRVLKAQIAGKPLRAFSRGLDEAAKHCSDMERQAMEAERAMDDAYKCRYMAEHIGDVSDGLITGVTNFGLFVTMENTIEGLIPIADLDDDYYVLNEKLYTLTGERKRKSYRLGDQIKVKVEAVDLGARRIELELVEHKPSERAKTKKGKKR